MGEMREPPDPKVFVVDDDPVVRDALALLLSSAHHHVQLFANAEEFLQGYRPCQPGCLLLDLRMPGMSGLDLQDKLKRENISVPIIFITGHGDVCASVRAFRAGAITFLEKPFDTVELLAAVDEALRADAGRRARHRRLAETLRRYARLTPREKEVMALLVAGHSNKRIARRLDISHRTIEVHRARIMSKMQTPGLPELVAMAVDADLCLARQDRRG